jgi:uncharacterized integral membrane protein (TIGR00698 family)
MRALMLRFMRAPASRACSVSAPGLALCALVALAAAFVAAQHGGPRMLYALLFGTALHHLHAEARTAPGVHLAAGAVLKLGVGLLGARVGLEQIAALGWTMALATVAAVAGTLLVGWAAARRLGLSRRLGILAGGATAICGASAAIAIAAVLPRHPELERETLAVVVLATLLSTVAMLAYPLVASALDLRPALAGLFLGGSIHDVAQVVVAGYTLGPVAGDAALVVKLFRVSLLALVVLAVALLARADDPPTPRPARSLPPVPGFVLLFLALAACHSLGALPRSAIEGLGNASQACLTVGVAALGIKTSFVALAHSGRRTAALMGITTAWIAAWMFAAAWLLQSRAA